MKISLLLLLLLFGLTACSDATTEPPTAVTPSAPIPQDAPPTAIERQFVDEIGLKEATFAFLTQYGDQYQAVAYALFANDQYYFVVAQGDWSLDKQNALPSNKTPYSYQLGLVSAKNQVIIPLQFDKIYNMGGTASNLLEVEVKGQRGLYDLTGTAVLPVQYDGIYPATQQPNVWAYWRNGSQFGALYGNGSSATLEEQPADLVKNWQFDAELASLIPFVDIEGMNSKESADPGSGILVLPSYLYDLGIAAEYNYQWAYKKGNIGMENTSAKVQTLSSKNTTTLLTAFDQSFIDARSYHEEKQSIVTVDQFYQPVDSILLQTLEQRPVCALPAQIRMIGTDTLEVAQIQHTPKQRYVYKTVYRYYHIQPDGLLQRLPSKGQFSTSQYTRLQPEHFKGCFARALTDTEIEALPEDVYASYEVTQHLSVEDLQAMRNEIYARHGYKFKQKKWQQYFAKEAWYQARQDEVESLLSPLEKQNAQFLLDYQKVVAPKEKEWQNPSYEAGNYAG